VKQTNLKIEDARMEQLTTTKEKKTRILVVDDEESIRDTFNIFLTDSGYDVVLANDGQSALASVRNQDFDVAVVDRILSGSMSGVEVIRDIKRVLPFCETILMSAYPSFESAAKIMEHETAAYLTKPVLQEEICSAVKTAARKSVLKKDQDRYQSMFKSFFDLSPNPIIVYDSSLCVQFVNPAFTELFDYSPADVLGLPLFFAPEKDTDSLKSELMSVLCGEPVSEREHTMTGNNGKLLDTSRIISLCTYLQGVESAVLVIIRNITEEKKIQAQLLQSEKLGLLGQLAAKLSHEIKNPVQVITGYGELLLLEPLSPEVRANISLMTDAARIISGLTSELMEIARPKPLRTSTFCIEQPLEKAAEFLLSIGETKYLQVFKHYGCAAYPVQGDFNQLEQVFMNLIINAAQSMQDAEKKIIRLSTIYDQAAHVVHLSVQDAGCGISPENIYKIFDPFFTTKEHGAGNGLGLSVVKQIIERHAGAIAVESLPGQGTTFTVTLPLASEAVQVVQQQAAG
jgi:PAS domain S-box-containing protein